MYKDYYNDIERDYGYILKGAYEKAKIWPQEDIQGGIKILNKRVREVESAFNALINAHAHNFYSYPSGTAAFKKNPRLACQMIEGCAMDMIIELLQVVAVCRKYAEVFEEEDQ